LVTIVTRRLPLVEQELLTFSEHPSSSPVFCGVHVAQFLVFSVVFCRSLIVLLTVTSPNMGKDERIVITTNVTYSWSVVTKYSVIVNHVMVATVHK
jgi:hypothetical protein